ncbi:hypothetical protein ACIBHX_35640 [Nonomuraea sp. NPDC050536]|uniref:hypothetical protein n=1 Tax=Nonomuraea sp. NPDC050536 TaxID=3364366 RepID=UPI0037C6418C
MNSPWMILGVLLATSLGIFVVVALLVFVPSRGPARRAEAEAVWLGGPSRSERGVSTSGLVLADRVAHWAPAPESDWVAAAETAEPSRRVGGASAGW